MALIKDELDIDGIKITFEQIEETLFNFGKDREWDSKLAKWTRTGRTAEQSLLAHALNTYSVAKKISLRLAKDIGLCDFDILIALIACFVHDQGKETDDYQSSTKTERVKGHCPIEPNEIADLKDCVRSILNSLSLKLQKQELETLLDIVFTSTAEHMKSEYTLARALNSLATRNDRDRRVASLVRTADTISSWKTIDDARLSHLDLLEGRVQLFYHKTARIRGLISYVLHKSMEGLAKQHNSEALLTYPNGTLYIGKENVFKNISKDSIIKAVETELKNVLNDNEKKSVNAIIGTPQAKPLKAPELLTADNVELVFERASRMYFRNDGKRSIEYILKKLELMSDPKSNIARIRIKDEIHKRWDLLTYDSLEQYRENNFQAMDSQDNVEALKKLLTDAESDRIVESAGDAFIFLIFNEILHYLGKASAHKIKDEFVKIFDNNLFERLDSIGGNDSVKSRLMMIDYFWSLPASELVGGSGSSNRKIGSIDNTIRKQALIKVLVKLLKETLRTSTILNLNHIAKMLVKSDLSYPFFADYSDNNYLSAYYKSKSAEDIGLCSICGISGSISSAIAGLTGEGSESFTNKLPAGKPLGGIWKARVCALCTFEGILRSIAGVPAAKEIVLLIPQVNISREIFETTVNIFNIIRTRQINGYIPLTDYRSISRLAASGNISINDAEVFIPKKKSNFALKKIQGTLQENEFKDPSDAISYLQNLKPSVDIKTEDWEDITNNFLENIHLIQSSDPSLFARLRNVLESDITFVFQTPHFGAVLSLNEIRFKKDKSTKESDSGAALRKLLIGLAFSKIMMCSVEYLKGLNILENPITKGAVKVPEVQSAVNRVKDWVDINDNWVSLRDRDELLKLVGSIFLVSNYTNLGVDSSFRTAYLSAGEILRRIEMKNRGISVLLRLLEPLKTIQRGIKK